MMFLTAWSGASRDRDVIPFENQLAATGRTGNAAQGAASRAYNNT
jgi:ATP-dependent protease HslVU (ClpYQ) peptidase subunit